MLITRASAKGCIHRPECTAGSFLHFLYQTATISRKLSADSGALRGHDSETYRRRRSSKQRDDTNTRESRTSRQSKPAGRQQAAEEQNNPPRPIPFEGKLPSHSFGTRVEGSTMTPRELRIFEQLFKAQKAKPGGKSGGEQNQKQSPPATGHKPQSKRHGAPAVETVREFPDLLRPLAEEAAALRAQATMEEDGKPRKEHEVTTEQQSEVFYKELHSIKSKMDSAQTDVALWEVLQNEVFKKIRRLPESSNSAQSTHDFQVLTQTLPQSLVHFMRNVRTSFPGSSLGLVLLPALKKLGPSAFALGASTELFNEHMWFLYNHYSDLDSIAETLSEMDKNVYEFDGETKKLIAAILQDGRKALKNNYGPGMQALWSTDRKTRGLEKIRRWEENVDERLKAAAMREQRDRLNDFSEDNEEDQKLAVE